MGKKLTPKEIKGKSIELHNVKRLYEIQKETVQNLKQKLNQMAKKNKELKDQLKLFSEKIEKLELQLEEKNRMLFKKSTREKLNIEAPRRRNEKSRERTNDSYRKKTPEDHEITDTISYKIDNCNICGTKLIRPRHITRYEEDVVLPTESNIPMKKVEKHIISVGYCPKCKRWIRGKEAGNQRTEIGENIKMLMDYMVTIMRLSYHQSKGIIQDLCGISVSDGEIAKILREHATKLQGAYENLKNRIKEQKGVHRDETTWKVQKEEDGGYCRIMKGTETSDAIYILGKNRGKGNVEKLKEGMGEDVVGISDDYGAYKNIFKYHQLCRAHPHRKLRDLAHSEVLDKLKQEVCIVTYEAFSKLYKEVEETLATDFDIEKRKIDRQKLLKDFDDIAKINGNEPEKLKKIKESLSKNREYYFTCVEHEGIPCDNNATERSLRHIVLKRKNSFGSKTQRGADVMSVLYSVLLSLWRKDPKNFFVEYSKLLED